MPSTLRAVFVRSSCWRSMRARSVPSPPRPVPVRARANASAVSPSRTCAPASSSSLAFLDVMSWVMHMGTPLMASTMSSKPEKSTMTKWPPRSTPVRSMMVCITHAAPSPRSPFLPPLARATLNFAVQPFTTEPSYILQSEIFTRESRGIDTTSMRERSALMCMTIVVSPRMPPATSPPISAFSPLRSSVPINTMLSGSPAAKSSGEPSTPAVSPSPLASSELVSCVSKEPCSSSAEVPPYTRANPARAATPLARPTRTRRCAGRAPWRARDLVGAGLTG